MISSVASTRLSTFYAYLITKIGNRNLNHTLSRGLSMQVELLGDFNNRLCMNKNKLLISLLFSGNFNRKIRL